VESIIYDLLQAAVHPLSCGNGFARTEASWGLQELICTGHGPVRRG